MPTPLDQLTFPLVVLDLEWNQRYGKQRNELQQEIVEIGAVKVDANFKIIDRQQWIVRPVVHTQLHKHVRALTGIDPAEWKSGLSFQEAANQLTHFCGQPYTLCTWGPDDLPVLERNLVYFGLPAPDRGHVLNLQMAYAHLCTPTPGRQISLADALTQLAVSPEYPAHRALSDAYHAALVLLRMQHILLESPPEASKVKGLLQAFEEEAMRATLYKDVVQTPFKRVGDVLANKALITCPCPLCEGTLSTDTPVFPAGGPQRYQQLATCSQHGAVWAQFQLQRGPEGLRVLRRIMLATHERAEAIKRRYCVGRGAKAQAQ